ncbi:DUF6421 family protein [Streptomyces tricolor]|nr:DUF6421 family protein [Streptomyces tricolor]
MHWFAGYELVSTYPSRRTPAPSGPRGPDALDLTQPPRKSVDDVLPGRVPLSMFYEALSKS